MAVLTLNDLSGSINHRSPGLLENNQFELLLNTSQAQVGNTAHRLGSQLFLNAISTGSNPIRGLGEFIKSDNTTFLHTVCQGTLYVNGVGTWTSQAASEWNTSSEIDMDNYIGRHYMASSTALEWLRYFTETGASIFAKVWFPLAATGAGRNTATVDASSTASTLVTTESIFTAEMVGMTIFNTTDTTSNIITAYTSGTTVTVGTAINNTWDGDTVEMRIDGKYLAVNGAYMLLGGNSVYPRRVYYSQVAQGDFAVSTDYFESSQSITGVTSFGNGRPFVAFSNNTYLVLDPQSVYVNEVTDYGCTSNKSIVNIKGNIIWLGQGGFYMLSPNQSYPTDISLVIKNDQTHDDLFYAITQSNFILAAAGGLDERYFCALQDLSINVRGQDIDSCVLEFDASQNNWKIHSYSAGKLGSIFANFTDTTGKYLYAGSYTNGGVFKLEIPSLYTDKDINDSTNTINSITQTKHYRFYDKGDSAIRMQNVLKLHFQYYSASTITVKYALDGSSTYTTLTTLPAYTATRWNWEYMDLGEECKSISLQLETLGNFIMYALGFELQTQAAEGIKGR